MNGYETSVRDRYQITKTDKANAIAELNRTQVEIDLFELHLDYADLVWRTTPNGPSIQEMLEHIVEAEQSLWQVLLPHCLHGSQQKIVREWYRIRQDQLGSLDSDQRIFRQLSMVRRMTLILLEDLDETAWLKLVERPTGVTTIGIRVRQFVDETRVYQSAIKRLLEERLALTSRGVVWN